MEIFDIFLFGWVFSKSVQKFMFLARRGCEDKPIILAGDFNVKLVELMKDFFELDIVSELSPA
jgi:hypothetical protein